MNVSKIKTTSFIQNDDKEGCDTITRKSNYFLPAFFILFSAFFSLGVLVASFFTVFFAS